MAEVINQIPGNEVSNKENLNEGIIPPDMQIKNSFTEAHEADPSTYFNVNEQCGPEKRFVEDLAHNADLVYGIKQENPALNEQPIDNLFEYEKEEVHGFSGHMQQGNPPQEAYTNDIYNILDEVEGNSEDEGLDDYKRGGYHPVHVGELLMDRYVIIQKLGWGHFSTVWLSRDFKYDTYVAIKVQKSASHYLEAAYDEVELLQKAAKNSCKPDWGERLKTIYGGRKGGVYTREDCHVVQLLNAFIYKGPYGNHFCMVFEILGVNLLEIIKKYEYKGVPMHICKKIAAQTLMGLDYLHNICDIIHTDLKPENVLLSLTHEELRQIVERGSLKRSPKYEEKIKQIHDHFNIKTFKEIIEECKDSWGEAADNTIHTQFSPTKEEIRKEHEHVNGETPKPKMPKQSDAERRQEELNFDPDSEYDKILKERGGKMNKREKKNLRKKLRKKAKRIRKKLGIKLAPNQSRKLSTTSKLKEALTPELNGATPDLAVETLPTEANGAPVEATPEKKVPLTQEEKEFEQFELKIADLGNACWVHHHFQPEIQTRQYRSPEVILGIDYNDTADVWSFACMIFEMVTGDFLFAPQKSDNFSKSDDHLALMMEALHKFPKKYACVGTNSKRYFDQKGQLKKIKELRYFPLIEVLLKTYHFKYEEAALFSDFLYKMLDVYPQKRASAMEMLSHPWLSSKTKNKDHICDNNEEVREAYDRYHSKKETIPFFRDLKDYAEEHFDADASEDLEEDSDDEDIGWQKQVPGDQTYQERNFGSPYVGYDDGIDVMALDSTSNWQFSV